MRSGFTPRFRELLHRADPALHLIAEVVAVTASDVKDTKDEWSNADSISSFTVLDGGGVQLQVSTAAAITQSSDDGTETDALSLTPPCSALLIQWSGTGAEDRELRNLVARLHPRPDGGSPKTVHQWRAALYRVIKVGAPATGRLEVEQISRVVPVSATGETAGDVTFDFTGWSGAAPKAGPPPTHEDPTNGGRLDYPLTLVRIWAVDEDGAAATNVAWMSDSTLGSSISGSGYTVTHYTLTEDDTEKGGDTVFIRGSTVAEMPRFTLNRSSYSAATITFSGANKPDLGAVPTGSVEIVADGLAPGDSSITFEANDGSGWVQVYDGDVVGVDNTAQGGADLSALTPAQTLSIRATLTPSSNTFLSPIVRRLGVREITKTDLAGVATVTGGASQVDPRTLKGNISKATVRILKTGERDYLDYGTQILAAHHIGEVEVRIWVGDPTYQFLTRGEWMHLDSFEVEDYKNGNTAHILEVVSPLRRLRRKIPPFVATTATEGTREPVEYLNQTIKAAAADIVDGQIGLPGRFVGPLIEDTTVVSKTITEADAKDELDRLAYLAGYGVITSQGRVKGVRMMRDDLGGDTPVATFLPGDYTPVDIGPGYAARVDEFFVPHSWSEQSESFSGEVRKFNATAFTRLGGQGLESSDRLDDETAKWIPSDVLATTVAERVPHHFGNGQILWAIRSTYRNPHLEPGDVVTVVTDQFVARSPVSDREVKGLVAATGIVATVGDFWGQNLLVWVPNIDKNIVAAEGTVTRLKYVNPQIIQATVGFDENGQCIFRAQVSDASSVRAALDTTSFPGRSTVQAASPVAVDSDGWAEITLGGTFDVSAKAWVSALPYENSDGTGAEGVTLWKKKVSRGISEYIKPRVFPRASQVGSLGLLTLEADDPQSRIVAMRVKTHSGGGDYNFETPDDGSWTDVSYLTV